METNSVADLIKPSEQLQKLSEARRELKASQPQKPNVLDTLESDKAI